MTADQSRLISTSLGAPLVSVVIVAYVATTEQLSLKSSEAVAKDSKRSRVIHLHVQSDVIKLAGVNQSLSASEGYVLVVLPERGRVDVTGTTTSGVFYGLQSLLSLLAASANGRTLPAVCLCFLFDDKISWKLLDFRLSFEGLLS